MTESHKRFADRYFETLNGYQSAVDVGFSEHTARQQAWQILQREEVQDYLAALKLEAQEKHNITKDNWLSELKEIGYSNIQDFINEGNNIKDISGIDRSKARAVSSVKKTVIEFEGGNKEITEFKLHDKKSALEIIGRHMGFFEKDNGQKIPEAPKTLKIEIVRPVEDDE